MVIKKFQLYLFLFFGLTIQAVFAGTVKGKVLDEFGEPMLGATVTVKGTEKYAIIGLDGSFMIKHIAEGSYTLSVSYLGYKTEEHKFTITTNNPEIYIDLKLKPLSETLGEVVINAAPKKGSVTDARMSEKKANTVVNILSAKTISQLPDVTVASVLQRVSGVTISRNSGGAQQYAIVRGMSKRYNYTLVNGVKIPSPSNKNRYVPLDIFPSSLLQKLEVYKTLTANMEGDAVGGVVNMVMKDAPEKFEVNANLQLGYNIINTKRDFLKFDKSVVNYKSPYELYGPSYQAQFSDFSKKNLVTKGIRPLPNVVGNFSIGNRFFDKKLGVLLGVGYQNKYNGSNSLWFNTTVGLNSKTGANSPEITELHNRTYSTQQTRRAIHIRADYRFNDNHQIKLYVGSYHLLNAETRNDTITNLDSRRYNPVAGNAIMSFKTRTRLIDQKINTATLEGKHKMSSWFDVNWHVVKSNASSQQPDIASLERSAGLTSHKLGDVSLERHMPRTWQHNTDKDMTGYLNLIFHPKFLEEGKGEISVGGMYRHKNRSNFYNSYTFDPLGSQIQGKDWTTYEQVNQKVNNPLGSPANYLNYSAHENMADGYIQGKYLFFEKTEVIAGVRWEHTDQGYKITNPITLNNPNKPASLSQKYLDMLPSINIKHMVNNKTNIRASYYESLNRPGYNEIVPYANSTQNETYKMIGNPKLKRAHAHNFDLRYELYPNHVDQILVGVFYKKIMNPIETAAVFQEGTTSIVLQPGNFGNARNMGLELSYTKYFQKFGIRANYTYTNSQITTSKGTRKRKIAGDNSSPLILTTKTQTRPLQGQAKNIGNLALLYKDQKAGLDMQVVGVYTGTSILNVSPFYKNDSWVKPFVQLGFSAEKKLGKRWAITLKAKNILNSPYKVIIKQPYLYSYQKYPYQSASSHTTLSRKNQYYQNVRLGVKFKF